MKCQREFCQKKEQRINEFCSFSCLFLHYEDMFRTNHADVSDAFNVIQGPVSIDDPTCLIVEDLNGDDSQLFIDAHQQGYTFLQLLRAYHHCKSEDVFLSKTYDELESVIYDDDYACPYNYKCCKGAHFKFIGGGYEKICSALSSLDSIKLYFQKQREKMIDEIIAETKCNGISSLVADLEELDTYMIELFKHRT